jgi:hypothetical protein
MATIYRADEPAPQWQNFQNAGPDVYWEVPTPDGPPAN